MKHQLPDYECKYGHTVIIEDSLFLAGEDDVDELLFGEKEARCINGEGSFKNAPFPQVDVWIDLRDIRSSNRVIFTPDAVEYISIPFRDGCIEEAREFLPKAKKILEEKLQANQRVLVTCHQGRSRSVMLLLWYLSEKNNSFFSAYWTIKEKRPIVSPDKNFSPILEEWKQKYPKIKHEW